MTIWNRNQADLNSHIASSSILLMKRAVFIKHFLIPPILYEGSTLINIGFLIKKDFWYVVLISDSADLNVCIISICSKSFSSISKIS